MTIKFTNSLYSRILNGSSVCQAYHDTINQIKKGGVNTLHKKYKLLIPRKHDMCITYKKYLPGHLNDLTEHMQVKRIQSEKPDYIKRDNDKFRELLVAILDQRPQKIINFHGLTGLGKTYIVRRILPYICARKFFQGGVMYVDID